VFRVHYRRKLKLIVGLLGGIRMVWLWRYDGEFFPSEAVFIVPSHFFLANSWTPRNRPRTAFPPGIPRDSSRVAVSLPNTYHFKPAPEELPEELLLTRH
jgi:hypothetical protein